MSKIKESIKKHSVLCYYILTFAITWGGVILAVGGPSGFPGTTEQLSALMPNVVVAMLAGPTVAGLLFIGLVDGKAGFRNLISRLLKWRAGLRWYAMALLPAPILAAIVTLALSLTPPLFTASDKAALIVSSIIAGFTAIFEEVGWTGFALPKLRMRYSIFATGLIMGVPWAAWHLFQIMWVSGSYTGDLSLTVLLPLFFLSSIAQLTPYRILLVWVYDRTKSLFITTIMHSSLIASTLFLFSPMTSGVSFLVYSFALAAAFWTVVAIVAPWRIRGVQPQ